MPGQHSKPWFRRIDADTAMARKVMANKPFLAWDGEGVVHENKLDMSYILFGHSDNSYITSRELSTVECLQYIIDTGREYRNFIHVSYGFGFDVDQILRHCSDSELSHLKRFNKLFWNGFNIEYIPRKWFAVHQGKGTQVKIYDTLSFFATTMIDACKQYLPGNPLIAEVERGKAGRSSFRYDELHSTIIPYWKREGELMVQLMDALRHSLIGAGIKLTSWHGPGAVATSLITKNRIGNHVTESRTLMPEQARNATSYAFFGGRFENFIVGRVPGPIYSYDIRSAYPAALSHMPGIMGGEWKHTYATSGISEWGIYRVTITRDASPFQTLGIGALPSRSRQSTVNYGLTAEGWYYGHELLSMRLSGLDFGCLTIHESYTYDSDTRPFAFLQELYLQRADWKRNGNPAQLAAKLGLNSIYGKLAQCLQNEQELLNGQPPRFHNQWYAGHTTAWCRARILLAMSQSPLDIISVETDGIYSRAPLKLRMGEQLGEWEAETYDEGIFLQSGVYFLRRDNEWVKAKTRGLGSVNVDIDTVIRALPTFEPITSTVHRYGNFTGYIGNPLHHTWFNQDRTINWGGGGKRAHYPAMCPGCNGHDDIHRSVITTPFPEPSQPRRLPWDNGDELLDWLGDDL